MNDYLMFFLFVGLPAAYLIHSLRKKKVAREGGAVPSSGWRIGPFDYSRNMPASPTMDGQGWYLDFPPAPGSVNYVQWFEAPSLVGKKELRLRYRLSEEPAVVPQEYPSEEATVSLIMQRKGDGWRSSGYRWWTGFYPLTPGEHEVVVPLSIESWGDMLGVPEAGAFAATIEDAWNIGVAFGSRGAPTHGVYGSGRFHLLELTVV